MITLLSLSILSSFFVSEVLRIPPCFLCWLQRGLVFLILLLALLDNKINIKFFYLFSVAGIFIAFYHIIIQNLHISSSTCTISVNKCDTIDFELFGFLTMPMLSFLNFILITILVYFLERKQSF